MPRSRRRWWGGRWAWSKKARPGRCPGPAKGAALRTHYSESDSKGSALVGSGAKALALTPRDSAATEIKVPTLGESVTSATIARWLKHAGDTVAADEPLVELETDKVTVEVPAPPPPARLPRSRVEEGAEVEVGAVLGVGRGKRRRRSAAGTALDARLQARGARAAGRAADLRPRPPPIRRPACVPRPRRWGRLRDPRPLARRCHGRETDGGTRRRRRRLGGGIGKDGRITKGDVIAFLSRPAPTAPAPAPAPAVRAPRAAAPGEERVLHDAPASHHRGRG